MNFSKVVAMFNKMEAEMEAVQILMTAFLCFL